MLKLRHQQVEVFHEQAEAALLTDIISHLREEHPDTVVQTPDGIFAVEEIAEDKLRLMVSHGISRARAYRFEWSSTINSFVVLMFVTAPNFDAHPLIQRVLQDEAIEPQSRVDKLWERTTDQNWEAVNDEYDPAAWGLPAATHAQS